MQPMSLIFTTAHFLGANLSISSAVFVDSICVDCLTTIIPFDLAACNDTILKCTVRIFHALATCINKLEQHYINIQGPDDIPKAVSNHVFPRTQGNIDLQYLERFLEGKQLWLATLGGKKVIVKFTMYYADNVHRFCAEKGIAPRLLHFLMLGDGWTMVVMEYLDGYHTLCNNQPVSMDVQTSIFAALMILHDADF